MVVGMDKKERNEGRKEEVMGKRKGKLGPLSLAPRDNGDIAVLASAKCADEFGIREQTKTPLISLLQHTTSGDGKGCSHVHSLVREECQGWALREDGYRALLPARSSKRYQGSIWSKPRDTHEDNKLDRPTLTSRQPPCEMCQSSPKQHKRSTESLAFGQGWHQHVASGPKMEEKPGTNEVMPAIASLSWPLSSPLPISSSSTSSQVLKTAGEREREKKKTKKKENVTERERKREVDGGEGQKTDGFASSHPFGSTEDNTFFAGWWGTSKYSRASDCVAAHPCGH
ncbi:hypothetical protein C0Q70_05103 [Pomacea canaliculata]|uniref:Uncharacterized protein n=1 Tax=Pomacea canaliculata TaxID=400727 RepID=A0A2T7PKC2_POMCA|nr:hypothetical protein C0Q70_05103 [Pomacea canaliculata]